MLTARQIDLLPDPITTLYHEYEDSVLRDIARRLAKMDMTSAAWQMQRLSESGKVYEHAIRELASITGESEETLLKIFRDAGVKAMRFDDAVYRRAGLNPLPLNLSPAMAQVLAAGLRKTQGLMSNLTMTTALSSQNAFIRAADLIYVQISSGAFDYQSALRMGLEDLGKQGLTTVNYASGRSDHLDVALRRTVLTGVNQTTGQLQLARADELGADLVQVSAHAGARNTGVGPANHAEWQGKVYSRTGAGKYPNFIEATGYGTGAGLMGWGCRHSFFAFFEGLSPDAYSVSEVEELNGKTVTYNKREMDFYTATQEQRAIERKIRYWKRRAGVMEAGGVDNTPEMEAVQHYQAAMRDFVKQTGLQRQRFREQVY